MKSMRFLTEFVPIVLLCLALPLQAEAGRLKPKKKYPVRWTESAGVIQTASVCRNYSRSSLDYRNCRSYAVDYFRAACRKHKKALAEAGGKARSRQRKLKRKFCSAYSRFSP